MVAVTDDFLRNSGLSRRRYRRAALYDLGAALARTLARWQRRILEGQELATLGARELKDIGLTPSEARSLRNQPIWR